MQPTAECTIIWHVKKLQDLALERLRMAAELASSWALREHRIAIRIAKQ